MCKKIGIVLILVFLAFACIGISKSYAITPEQCTNHWFLGLNQKYKYSDATCQQKARYYKTCKYCGLQATIEEYIKANNIPPQYQGKVTYKDITYEVGNLGRHIYQKKVGDEHLKTAATCTRQAVYYTSCIYCGVNSTSVFSAGDKAKHQGQKTVANKYLKSRATCISKAEYYQNCKVCGAILKDDPSFPTFTDGDFAGHTAQRLANEKYIKTAATCQSQAEYYQSCKICETALKDLATFRAGSKAAHKATKKVDDKYLLHAATCSSKAEYYRSCKWCGRVLKNEKTFTFGTIPTHQKVRKVEKKYLKSDATCQEKAVYYHSCFWCGKKLSTTFKTGKLGDHEYKNGKCKYCGKTEEVRTTFPGLNGTVKNGYKYTTKGGVEVQLKNATKGNMTLAVRESKNIKTNTVLVFFPGSTQTSSIIKGDFATRFNKDSYNVDIIAVAAKSTSDWKNVNQMKNVLYLLDNYIKANYNIVLCGYSYGGYGAVTMAEQISRGKFRLVLIDGVPKDQSGKTSKERLDTLLNTSKISSIKIIASRDKSSDIAKRISGWIDDNTFSSKYKIIDLSGNSSYNEHGTVEYYCHHNINNVL